MWIRTQDRKNLCEVKNKIGIIHDGEDTEIPIGIFLWDSSLTMLGEYKTKERALKVIDEIQNQLLSMPMVLKKYIDLDSGYNHTEYKQNIYNMPIE